MIRRMRSRRGMTLIEVMIALVILTGALLGMGKFITSFSHAPLQAATLLGFAFSLLAFLAIPLTVVARYTNMYERGVPSTIVIILLLGGIQLITVGIIGEYVGRIYDEVKHRPLYVVRERVNVEAPERPERPERSETT